MRCGRCGKRFDEDMYSGICPKCGQFNNRHTEYDVSRYFSARFDDDGKTSTSAQAAKQHDKLHEMYDQYNMHRPGAQQGGTYQAKTAQGNAGRQAQTGTYQQGGYSRQGKYGQAKRYEKEKEKNFVTPICAVIAVFVIVYTVAVCNFKRQKIAEIYQTVDFERETAEAGQVFEVNGRLLLVDRAEVVDTSMMSGVSEAEKLIAVTVKILPADEWTGDWEGNTVYVSDGEACRKCIDRYTLEDIISLEELPDGEDAYAVMEEQYDMLEAMEEELVTGRDYLSYSSVDGRTGKFYFIIDQKAESISISFDQGRTESGISVLEKRVSIPLVIEEVS